MTTNTMQFQFDFRSGSCCVSGNLSRLPDWVQKDMSKWKDGDKFSILVKKIVGGKSVYVETTFELKKLDEKHGPY